MKITLLPHDSPAYPGPLAGRKATFGEIWVGPGRLLELLETATGLGGPSASEGLRVASLIPVIRSVEGFWSRSFDSDSFAVARAVLAIRDSLALFGWEGQHSASDLGRRLANLRQIEREIPDGLPDRLARVTATIRRRLGASASGSDAQVDIGISEIRLFQPRDRWPLLWRRLLDALEVSGVSVVVQTPESAPARGDLAAARGRAFSATGDGSLQLVRPRGPLEAAEDVAAWLASRETLEGTVVIGADAVLDAALDRYGLPTVGAASNGGGNDALLQILPLAIALGWDPPDPSRGLELLTIAENPIPRGIGRRLINALHEFPAIGSTEWIAAIERGLESIEDTDRRERVRERLDVLLSPVVAGDEYPIAEIRRRSDMLAVWLHGRRAFQEEGGEIWEAPIAQVHEFRRLVDASGLETFTRPQLDRFLREATRAVPTAPRHPACAGLRSVRAPDALLAPARCVIWWSFSRDSIPVVSDRFFSATERRELVEIGVALPDPTEEALGIAAGWRRPLFQATECLLLVCPRVDESGTRTAPHPLWDELEAKLEHGRDAIVVDRPFASPPVPRSVREVLALPRRQRDWHVAPGVIQPRYAESPTSLGALLGCSFKWFLERQAGVKDGATGALPGGALLLGKIVHEVLAVVLAEPGHVTPDAAADRAVEVFRDIGPRLAAPLFLKGAESLRETTEQTVRLSTRELLQQLSVAGATTTEIETLHEVEIDELDWRIHGRPDLVVGPRTAVVDLKWSGSTYHRQRLEAGTAYQLATYARLVRHSTRASLPPVAYYVLSHQRFLATDRDAFPHAEIVDGPTPDEIWSGLMTACRSAWVEVSDGALAAPGFVEIDKEPKDELIDGLLSLAPPCYYCDLKALCGRELGGGS